jgi:hypothetical protein
VCLALHERDVFGESVFGLDFLPHAIRYHGVVIDAASQFVKPQAVAAEVIRQRGTALKFNKLLVEPSFYQGLVSSAFHSLD